MQSLVEIIPMVLKKILNFFGFLLFHKCTFHWKSVWPFIWTKYWIPSVQECYQRSLVEIGPMIVERFLNFINVFLLFHYHLLFKEGMALYLKKNLNLLLLWMFCAKLIWNWPGGSGAEVKNVESLQKNRQTMDERQSE